MAIKSDGTLWATGNNFYGGLGLNDTTDRDEFTQVGSDTDWVAVSAGLAHSFAIKNDGTLWATGKNFQGQLGSGDTTSRDEFTQVGVDTDWVRLGYLTESTFAIKSDGSVWVTGYNGYGQLGLGDTSDRLELELLGNFGLNVTASAGYFSAFIIGELALCTAFWTNYLGQSEHV